MSEVATKLYVDKRKSLITIGVNADYNYADYASPQLAIQAAIDAYTSTGATLLLNTSCTLTGSVNPKSNVDITSLPSVVVTFNSGHVAGVPTAPNSGFHAFVTTATSTNFSIYNLRFNGGLTTLTTGVDGAEYHAIYIRHGSHDFTIRNIYGTRTASGVLRFRDACYAFIAENIKAFESDAAIISTVDNYGFTLRDIKAVDCFAEGLFLGDGIHDFTVDSVYASGCTRPGLSINSDDIPTSPSYNGNISNIYVEGPVSSSIVSGIYLTYCNNMNFTNLHSRRNGRDGVLTNLCNYIDFSNVQCWNNNRLRIGDGTSQYAGIRLYDSKYIKLSNVHCDDDGSPVYQYRGIYCDQSTAGATNNINVIGGRSDNTVSSTSVVIIGNASTIINHGGYNPNRWTDRGNVSATPSLLLKNSDTQQLTITQNTVLQSLDTNATPGQLFTLIIKQDATGGHTFTFPSNAILINGTWKPDTSANAVATITFKFISSSVGWYEVSRSDNTFGQIPIQLFSHYADAGNSGTGETDLYSDTIAASQLSANGQKILAQYAGTFVNNATATRQLKIYFGGTVIFDSGALSVTTAADWDIKTLIIRDSSTSVRCTVSVNLTGASIGEFANYATVTGLTLSNTQILKITGTASGVGAATNDIVAGIGYVEWKPA